MKKLLFSSVILSIIILSCTKSNYYEDNKPKVIITTKDTCSDSIRYNPEIKRILNKNCAIAGCHESGGQSPDLTNYASVKAAAANIKRVTCDDKTMPQDPNTGTAIPITDDCTLNKIKAWVSQGALENK